MAETEYVLVAGSASPYLRMLKFYDGVPTIAANFPGMASPIPIGSVAFSPDGNIVMAGRNGSSADQMRAWLRLASGAFVEFIPGSLPVTDAVEDIKFITNTHVAVLTTANGLYMGVVDVANRTVSWVRATGTNPANYNWIAPHTDGVTVVCTSNSGLINFFLRSGDTIASTTGSFQGTAGKGWPSFDVTGRALWVTSAVSAGDQYPHAPRRFVPTRYLTYAGLSIDTSTAGVVYGPACWSKDARFVFYSYATLPRLGTYEITVHTGSALTAVKRNPGASPNLPITANAIACLTGDRIIVGLPNNSAGTGRVRAFDFNRTTFEYTEVDAVSDLFDDWSFQTRAIAISPPVTEGDGAGALYNSSIKALLDGTVNLPNLKIALVSSAAVFNPAHTTLAAAIGANEVYGSSWPQGGVALGAGTFTQMAGTKTGFKADFPSTQLNDPGTLTFRGAIVYDDLHTDKRPLLNITFSENKTAVQGEVLEIVPVAEYMAFFEME